MTRTLVPPGGIPVNGGYGEDMGWIRAAVGARQRLWLLLGVVAVALSLLTMHQLSSNHTVADAAAPADGTMHLSVEMAHVDSHEIDSGGSDHAHLTAAAGDGHPSSEAGGCPGCADPSAMAPTCLALVLLVAGWILTRPLVGRGLRLRRLLPLVPAERRSLLPRPRSLAELSVSRT